MRKRFMLFTRQIAIAVGWVISKVLLDVKVTGVENLPRNPHPLIVIANHFSWFDAPILAVHLLRPRLHRGDRVAALLVVSLVRQGVQRHPHLARQVDREAFRRSMTALKEGYVLGIFPEGGMDPDFAEAVARRDRQPLHPRSPHPCAGAAQIRHSPLGHPNRLEHPAGGSDRHGAGLRQYVEAAAHAGHHPPGGLSARCRSTPPCAAFGDSVSTSCRT